MEISVQKRGGPYLFIFFCGPDILHGPMLMLDPAVRLGGQTVYWREGDGHMGFGSA